MSVLTATIGAWKDVKFEDIKSTLDRTAGEIAATQDESDISRNKLVTLSRDFKSNTPAEARKAVAPLLKSFQAEVDALTKRAKCAEVAYLEVYKRLIDLPDPAPAFDYVSSVHKKLQRISDLEIENKQLRERLVEYNTEFAEVKNQEVTVKQLREKVRELEESADLAVSNAIRDKEKQLMLQYGEKEKDLAAKQLEIARKLGEAELKASSLQQSYDISQTEIFDLRQRLEERQSARADEVEMLVQDLDRAKEKLLYAQREAEQFKQQLVSKEKLLQSPAVQVDNSSVEEMMRRADLEMELATKEREISQLVDDNRKLQRNLTDLRESSYKNINDLEADLAAKTSAVVKLEERLKRQTDYDEVKKELRVLKSIQFGSGVGEDDQKSLEQRLLEQNRTLQDEVTQLRMRSLKLDEENKTLLYEVKDSQREVQEHKKLIMQLEEDLQKIKAFSSLFRGKAEGEETSKEAAALASVVEQMELSHSTAETPQDSLLSIVQSQRERFRTRAQELEVQCVTQQQQVQFIQSEADRLRSDNVKLYEKIRFLQSYNGKEGADGANKAISSYSADYEARLDPFTTFSKKEKQRSYANLRPHDKLTLSVGRFIMSNQTARAVFFFYVLLLHLLVFIVLYRMAHIEGTRRDLSAKCERSFAEHMLSHHHSSGNHKH